MKTIAVIQARIGSTRLPAKVLKPILERSMLAHVVERTRRASTITEVVVATTDKPEDEVIVAECKRLETLVSRGSELDVLDRYHTAAIERNADAVVRITSDCPLIDPEVIDHVVRTFLQLQPDYASNKIEPTYPRGLDTEIMTMTALERAWREASESYQRVHVTPYFYEVPGRFRIAAVKHTEDYSRYRWTVDTPEDLAFVRNVYQRLGPDNTFSWQSVLDLLELEPSLSEINRGVIQKDLKAG